jgi:predicted nucleotidyltransferase
MMIHPIIQPELEAMIELFKKHKVNNAFLFGSVLTDRFGEDSDVDILVNFHKDLPPLEKGELIWSLRFALEDSLHREVDLITESSLKNPYFVEELNEKRVKIYEQGREEITF